MEASLRPLDRLSEVVGVGILHHNPLLPRRSALAKVDVAMLVLRESDFGGSKTDIDDFPFS